MAYLHQHRWDGVVSPECHGSNKNTRRSVEWMKGVVNSLRKNAKR